MQKSLITALKGFSKERLQPRARVRRLEGSFRRQLALMSLVWGFLCSESMCYVLLIKDFPITSWLSSAGLFFSFMMFLSIGLALIATACINALLAWLGGRVLGGEATLGQTLAAIIGSLLPLPWIGSAWLILCITFVQKAYLSSMAFPIEVGACILALTAAIFIMRASILGLAEVNRFGLVRASITFLLSNSFYIGTAWEIYRIMTS